MPIIFGKAPGKIILFGEHAVVYGQPAIAIPVMKVDATARVFPNLHADPGQIHLQAADIQLDADLDNLPEDDPLATAVRLTINAVAPSHIPAFILQISSSIPVSAGMGSSAAIAVAAIRAISAFLGNPLSPSEVSDITFQVEKIHHGTPSGIDNNVIAHQRPVYFVREKPIQFLTINQPTYWVIADTGGKTPTRETVSAVRALHAANSEHTTNIFQKIGEITQKARAALCEGDLPILGGLMNENQRLLEQLNVSSQKLEHLIEAARNAGAYGAKLSGSGRGGNLIALAASNQLESIEQALIKAGAERTITTLLNTSEAG